MCLRKRRSHKSRASPDLSYSLQELQQCKDYIESKKNLLKECKTELNDLHLGHQRGGNDALSADAMLSNLPQVAGGPTAGQSVVESDAVTRDAEPAAETERKVMDEGAVAGRHESPAYVGKKLRTGDVRDAEQKKKESAWLEAKTNQLKTLQGENKELLKSLEEKVVELQAEKAKTLELKVGMASIMFN
jgi:hypothetical protein